MAYSTRPPIAKEAMSETSAANSNVVSAPWTRRTSIVAAATGMAQ